MKAKIRNRILSLVLTFVMVLGMLPTVALAASTPMYYESIPLDSAQRPAVYANGTDLIIEEGSNGTTSVYYMNGNTKTAVVENTDLSNAYILAGYESSNSKLTDNVTITMNGGSVASILVGHTSSGSVTGNVTIIMKESAQVNAVLPRSASGNTTISGKLRIFAANGRYGGTISGRSFDGQIVKTSSGWSVSGDAVVPAGCTMTIDSGTTVTVANGTTLTNNGTILNNGTIHLKKSFTQLQGTEPTGSGSYIVDLPYVADASAVTAASVDCAAVESPSFKALGGKLYLDVPQGKVWAAVDGKEYYCDFSGAETAMQPYTSVTDISGVPTSVNANTSTTLAATVQPDGALPQSFTYAITDAGTTGASLSGSTLTTPFGGTVSLGVTATDGHRSFTKAYSIAVDQVAVTGIANDSVIPASAEPSSITLPTQVTPNDAAYQNITWTVSGPATVSGSTLKLSGEGTVSLTATVKNGLSNGRDYTKTYTISVSAPTELDIGKGNITIKSADDGNGHTVTYYNASGQQQTQVYAADKLIVITGTTTTNKVTIESGSPKLVLKNCSIQLPKYEAIDIYSSVPIAAEITLEGENTLSGFWGIYVPSNATLMIDGSGSLTATGGSGYPAIGGGNGSGVGDIVINGGTVTAYGGSDSAGIGGPNDDNSGEIIINGGTVNATGGSRAAGIGGSYNRSGTVTVNGGTVNATGGSSGAGIGGGYNGSGTVTINGGTVVATGGTSGAGIGGGRYEFSNNATTSNVTITDGTVTATGGDNGAGIGGGYKSVANVTISGGTVTARTGTDNTSGAAGIGCGYDGSGSFSIIISGGTVDAIGHYEAAGIGGSYRSKNGSVTISGGKITAAGGSYAAAAIGGGYHGDVAVNISGGTITAQTNATYSVGNGTVTITGGSLKVNGTVNAPTNGEANGSQSLAQKVLTIDGLTAQTDIASAAGLPDYYGLNDVQTVDSKLYFYLPGGYPESITTNGGDTYYHAGNGLYTDHQHRCSYRVNEAGDTIIATCSDVSDCPNPDCGSVTITAPGSLTYTGSKIEAVVDNTLTTGATVNVEYTGNTTDGYPVNVGEYTAKITLDGKEISVKYTITAASIESASVTVGGAYTYDGTAKEPTDITVILGGKTLTKDTDYTVSEYSDNVNAGTAKVTIKGMGNYEGEATGTFTITDEIDPTGEIDISTNKWYSFLNTITFGLFFKDNVDVTVTADGTGSDVVKVEYLLSETALDKDNLPTAGWEELTASNGVYSFSVLASQKAAVYVRITDEGGNTAVINSNGIVVYKDSVAVTSEIVYTYKQGEDKNISVTLNGNTVKSVACGGTRLAPGSDYTASADGTITLTKTYLDTLNAGEYTFTVYYNPMGVVTDKVTVTTTFTVTVEKADGKVSNINISGKTYDGTAVIAPTFDKLGDGEATIEYKVKDANDSTYTTTAPSAAGDYVVRVTVAEGTNYKEASATAEFTISKAAPTAQNFTWYDNIYATYNGQTHEINVVFFNDEGKYSGMGEITVKYYDENGLLLPEAPKNAGAYTFKIDVAEGANYDAATDITGNGWSLLISRRSVTIIPDAVTKTYGEKDPTLTYTVGGSGLVSGETLSGSLSREQGENVGSYAITPGTITYENNPNYIISVPSDVNFVITKASYDMSDAKWNYTEAYDYDGTEKTVEVIGLPNGVTVSGYEGNKATAVGDYTAKVTFQYDNVNYNAPVLADRNWSIKNDWTPTEYTVSTANANGWLNDAFTITPANGYYIATTNTADSEWKDQLTYSAETANGGVTFYLKNAENGKISLGKTVAYKLDKTPATGTVTFTDAKTTWDKILETISFGIFVNTDQNVTVTSNDDLSGVAKVEYYETEDVLDLAGVQALDSSKWLKMTNGSVTVSAEDTKQFIYYIRITDNAGNVSYLSTNGAEFDTTAPVISGIENGATYYTTQVVTVEDKNLASVTLNGEKATLNNGTLTLAGNVDATYTIKATDKAGNVTEYTVTMKTIAELTKSLDDITVGDVTSDDKEIIEQVIGDIDEQLANDDLIEGEKAALEETKDKAQELLDKIDETAKADDTENTEKVKDITADNVTPEDKSDLEKAKEDLEKVLDDYSDNLTEDEKKAIEDEIDRIDKAIAIIEKVETAENKIGALPKNITKNDEAAIKAAEDAYNALTDYEKSLVDKDAKKALDDAKAALAELGKPADTTSPNTGDNSDLWLWFALLFISGGAIIALTVVDRKRRTAR